MSGRVDLHVHTTASDGQFSPTEIVQQALAIGLTTIAVTDHDTIDGVSQALQAAKGTQLEVIPGVELSTVDSRTEAHVLGYYINQDDASLRDTLARLRDSRLLRAQRILTKLARIGMPLDWDEVQRIAGEAVIGRPHISLAMLERGYVSTVAEAFDLYIGRGRPAYEERHKLLPAAAVHTILGAGGLPVLAHPLQVSYLVPALTDAGLLGLEAYYPGYAPDEIQFLLSLAEKHALIATGGSDFHGTDVLPGHDLGSVTVPYGAVQQLRACYQRRHLAA
jgi:predicted metal-dependent phosphoesterase TrpH